MTLSAANKKREKTLVADTVLFGVNTTVSFNRRGLSKSLGQFTPALSQKVTATGVCQSGQHSYKTLLPLVDPI